ncbi:LysR substrate-binding domain-containing protein [Kribbella sp. NPDC023855]|uniref:LysR substrate-binding domain-containing protein n=1 Tax=Kribbella sp. NPDC023855 TaxID=3154698 RepID=UPI0033FD0220
MENGVQFVRHGVGLGILPGYAVAADDRIRAVPIVDENFQWSLYMATLRKRKPSAALRALLGLATAHLRHPEGTELGADLMDQHN